MVIEDLIHEQSLTLDDIIELTTNEGDAWKLSHVRQVLQLIELIESATE